LGSYTFIRHAAALLLLPIVALCLLLVLPEDALAAVVRDGVRDGIDGMGAADPWWLVVAGLAFGGTLCGCALAWRSALRACGVHCGPVDAVARYGIGSLANAVLPAKLGGVLRIGLFSRLVTREGAVWTAGGAAAVVGAARSLWLAALVAVASTTGVLPVWPALALVAAGLLGAAVALVARKTRWHARAAHVLDSFRALARRPRAAASVFLCVGLAVGARVVAAAALASAFGVSRPLAAGLLVIAAVELAAVLPLNPGSAGMAAAAVAFALKAHGASSVALSAGMTFAAVETSTSIVLGTLGALVLGAPACARFIRLAPAPEPVVVAVDE
jgi:uncharacterized membrane protein YbhN (UPF0104 family)